MQQNPTMHILEEIENEKHMEVEKRIPGFIL